MSSEEAGDDLRASLEKAVEQASEPEPAHALPPSEQPAPPSPAEEPPGSGEGGEKVTEPPPELEGKAEAAAPTSASPPVPPDLPPKSWKPAATAKWASVDPEIRGEVLRREREMTRSFGENSQAREFHKGFQEAVRPYEARVAQFGGPLKTISNLLQADHYLSSAPPVARARLMAQYIADYGIDVRELDAALAGQQPADPASARLEHLLEQRLAPVNQYIEQQRQLTESQDRRVRQEATDGVDAMEADQAKYPHFAEVREEMADIIELSSRRGAHMTLPQAYERAVAMNPAWADERVAARVNEARIATARSSNDRAQRALNASSSVKSTPAVIPANGTDDMDLRSAIEAAWSQAGGR